MKKKIEWLWQRVKCIAGYHGSETAFLQRTDQRRMVFVCKICRNVTRHYRLSKEERRSLLEFARKFGGLTLWP